MAVSIYYDKDADLGRLDGKTVADHRLWEPGSRPRPESATARASTVVVGLRKDSASVSKAEGARASAWS